VLSEQRAERWGMTMQGRPGWSSSRGSETKVEKSTLKNNRRNVCSGMIMGEVFERKWERRW
jgi:hypothetical protein